MLQTHRTKDWRHKTPTPTNPWIDTKSQHGFHVVIETMTTCYNYKYAIKEWYAISKSVF